jgi:hypothetical protein
MRPSSHAIDRESTFMKRLFARLLTTALVALAAVSAHASRDFYWEGTVVGPAGDIVSKRTQINDPMFKPMADAQVLVMAQLRANLLPPLVDAMKGIEGYQSGYATLDGPIELTYRNGEVTFSGLKVTGSATVKRSQFGISATCSVTLVLDPATTIVGQIDPMSGLLVAKEIRNFKFNPSYFCSTSLDWIPVVNLLVDSILTHKVDAAIADATQLAYNKIGDFDQLRPLTFMGVNALVDSAFGVGSQYVTWIKNSIAGGLQNLPYLYVQIGDPKHRVYGPQGYPHEAGSHDLIMTIGVGDYRLDLGEHRIYYDEMYCPPPSGNRSCFPF